MLHCKILIAFADNIGFINYQKRFSAIRHATTCEALSPEKSFAEWSEGNGAGGCSEPLENFALFPSKHMLGWLILIPF